MKNDLKASLIIAALGSAGAWGHAGAVNFTLKGVCSV